MISVTRYNLYPPRSGDNPICCLWLPPSSGIILVYDPSLKTFVAGTDSLGPILGERAETVGRHRLFVGFSYQFFDFDKLDGVKLNNFPNVLTHADDSNDNSTPTAPITCSTGGHSIGGVPVNSAVNLGGCAFVRDRIDTQNTISLKVSQYTTYVTFGLTKRIDISAVIPIETVRFSLYFAEYDCSRLRWDERPF